MNQSSKLYKNNQDACISWVDKTDKVKGECFLPLTAGGFIICLPIIPIA